MTDNTYAAQVAWRCPHCDSVNELLPGGPDTERERWALGVTHEQECPDFHDIENMPAVEHHERGHER